MPKPNSIDTGFKVDEAALWAMDIPVEDMPLSDLSHNLDIPYLEKSGTDDWNLTPRMLIEGFDMELLHADAVNNADMKYPIEIYFHKGKWIILDGVHRFTKAVRLGCSTIRVRKVSEDIVNLVKK